MRRLTTILMCLNMAAPAFAGAGLSSSANGFRNFFDGSAVRGGRTPVPMPRVTPSETPWWRGGPDAPGLSHKDFWGDIPEIKNGRPTRIVPTTAHDALREIEACRVVDVVYVRQPSVGESVDALEPCLTAMSKRYKVRISAVAGTGGLVLVIGAPAPSVQTLKRDLRYSLRIRNGQIFGHVTEVLDLSFRAVGAAPSSLQLVVDQCPTTMVLQKIRNGREFAQIYGQCLVDAKGLTITEVRESPLNTYSVLVFSRDRQDVLARMSGAVTVPTEEGPTTFQVIAIQELMDLKSGGKAVGLK